MRFNYRSKLDLRVGDIIRINGGQSYSSEHIIIKVFSKPYGENDIYGVTVYPLRCREAFYEDDIRVGTITPLYLEEFLSRSPDNSLDVLYRI